MIVAWMLYSLLVAALLGVAAIAADFASRLTNRSTRWIWLASLAGTVSLPLLTRLFRTPGIPVESGTAAGTLGPAGSASLVQTLERWWSATAIPSSLEIPLLAAWIGASILVLAVLVTAYVRLHGELRRWRRERVEDVEVRVSEDRGPAVVGFARIEVVLPRWVLACTATERPPHPPSRNRAPKSRRHASSGRGAGCRRAHAMEPARVVATSTTAPGHRAGL